MKSTAICLCTVLISLSASAASLIHSTDNTEDCYGIALAGSAGKYTNSNIKIAQSDHDPCFAKAVPKGECVNIGYKDKKGNMHYGKLMPAGSCKK